MGLQDRFKSLERQISARRGKGVYRSCSWIEEGVFIAGREVKMCCMRNLGNDVVPTFFEIDDPREGAKKLLENKRALRIANQTEKTPCHGCYLLTEQKWTAKESLRGIAIGGFMHCNLACTYCTSYQHDPSDRGTPILATLKTWHEMGILQSGSYIDMGGGESTLHREFEEIAAFAFENGITMRAFTNGIGLSKSLLEGLRKRLANIIVSVDAGTAETYRRVKGKDVLHRVWATLKEYASIAPDLVQAKYIVMDSNRSKAELDAFHEEALRAGVTTFAPSVNVFQNQQSAGELSDSIKRSIAYLLKRGRSAGIAELADTISPTARSQIEVLALLDDQELMGETVLANWRGQLELAFSNSQVFLNRARSIIAERDPFVIQFSSPIDDVRSSDFLRSAADEAVAAGATIGDVKNATGQLIGMEVSF